jgi:hypothetical protein
MVPEIENVKMFFAGVTISFMLTCNVIGTAGVLGCRVAMLVGDTGMRDDMEDSVPRGEETAEEATVAAEPSKEYSATF